MKALSIQQPWAWAIIHGGKPIKNRTWKTNFRGEFLIHAGKHFDREGYLWLHRDCRNLLTSSLPHSEDIPTGGIVGKARIIDCVDSHPSPFFFGPYGFVLEDTHPVEFVSCKGKLGFFEVDWKGK